MTIEETRQFHVGFLYGIPITLAIILISLYLAEIIEVFRCKEKLQPIRPICMFLFVILSPLILLSIILDSSKIAELSIKPVRYLWNTFERKTK